MLEFCKFVGFKCIHILICNLISQQVSSCTSSLLKEWYPRMFSVLWWGCYWFLFMLWWFCLIRLIGRKSLHFKKKTRMSTKMTCHLLSMFTDPSEGVSHSFFILRDHLHQTSTCDNSAITLAILFSLKPVDLLGNGLQPQSGVNENRIASVVIALTLTLGINGL